MVDVLPEVKAGSVTNKIDSVMKLHNGFVNCYKKGKAVS
jgi:hypothetical protein